MMFLVAFVALIIGVVVSPSMTIFGIFCHGLGLVVYMGVGSLLGFGKKPATEQATASDFWTMAIGLPFMALICFGLIYVIIGDGRSGVSPTIYVPFGVVCFIIGPTLRCSCLVTGTG